MIDQIQALEHSGTCELVLLSLEKTDVGCRLGYVIKVGPIGEVNHLEVKLVVKGYNQIYGLDYGDIFSSMAKNCCSTFFLAMDAIRHWTPHYWDVKNAFLHGELEEYYMEQPLDFVVHGEFGLFRKHWCSLYDLNQCQ